MKNKQNNGFIKNPFLYILIIVVLVTGFQYFFTGSATGRSQQINYSQLVKEIQNNNVTEMSYQPNGSIIEVSGTYKKPKESKDTTGILFFSPEISKVSRFTSVVLPSDTTVSDLQKLAAEHETEVTIKRESSSGMWINLLISLVPFIIIAFIFMSMMNQGGGGARGAMNFGRNKARAANKEDIKVRFSDVAGAEEEKQELVEVVEFLKDPKRYTKLGARIPAGVLLEGPPGTGKTLLAKAVAGEAGVPFFSISGSDFVEMFVGVGASRVRDLFRQAKEKSPCIIFIDEIDAVGRARSKNPSTGGNDERENTLNALLTEMDGFGTNSGVIILAATNRVDMLDSALLRAGRFDRQISVELPDLHERKEIFQVHLRNVKIDDTIDIDFLARQTPGFSGADIANVCNESALIAARHNKKQVGKQDFLDAVDRIIGGLEKKTKVMTANEKRTIALHEAGHATISWFCEHANPLVKVSIVPRGQALGAAWYLPEERQITTKEQMLDEMCALFGGRAAEELCTGHISTGAMNDLERATKSAYGMVAYAGMSDALPNVCFYNNQEYQFQRPYSETTAKLIDEEVLRLLNEQYNRAKQILTEHKEGHARLAELLITKEVIFAEDVEEIFGKRPWRSRTQEIIEANEKANELTLENMPEEVRKAEEEHQRMKNEQSQEAE